MQPKVLLKELLRTRLIECGWRDQLKVQCKEVVREKGLENVTVDDLVTVITPKGRALVPDSVKKELLQRIKTFLAQQTNL
ncbi:Transcription and mRNA export factor ENY2 [Amphibalanus amphitrite]|uniref:Transcription and mRNA export factor ENY2 n=1 Tax=Amphibalanus amphitrite TaxID=1232801 RepID=A0A6A4WG74_AMPAM|nr:Transcription and mRNA export factor ENY2 [Amphibalanus amphitrite]